MMEKEGAGKGCHIQVQPQQLILTPIVSHVLNAVVARSVLEVWMYKEQEESESSVELLLMIQKL